MSEYQTFSSEQLTAYLDGEADQALAHAIYEARAGDADLRQRLERLSVETHDIRQAFDALLPIAPGMPASIVPAPAGPQRSPMPWRAIAASALIGIGVGWGASTLSTRATTQTWQHYAATYHAMYVTETLAASTTTAQPNAADLKRVSEVLGLTIAQDTLSRSEQLDFKRAQVLGFEGRPVIQLAFLSKAGVPVALCITRRAGPVQPVRPDSVLGMAAATWATDTHEYLLIGGRDGTLIAQSAVAFAKSL